MEILMFLVIKRIYESEDVPDCFLLTELSQLFKKGDPRCPSSYRFIHGRVAESRLLELAIYHKMTSSFDKETKECQLGGMPQSSTTEHLALLIAVINALESENSGLIVTFQDIVKCFDKMHFSDVSWPLLQKLIEKLDLSTLKALKMQTIISDNKVKIKGYDETFDVDNGSKIDTGLLCSIYFEMYISQVFKVLFICNE